MKSAAVSARALLPKAFKKKVEEVEEESEEEYDEENSESEDGSDNDDNNDDGPENTEDVVDDLEYDVYNLVASNYHAIRFLDGEDKEKVIQDQAQRAAQLLMKRYHFDIYH